MKKARGDSMELSKYCPGCRTMEYERVDGGVDYGMIAAMLRTEGACPYEGTGHRAKLTAKSFGILVDRIPGYTKPDNGGNGDLEFDIKKYEFFSLIGRLQRESGGRQLKDAFKANSGHWPLEERVGWSVGYSSK